MTARFQVFLPPILSPPDGSQITIPSSGLVFYDLPRPPRASAGSQSLVQRHTERSLRLIARSDTSYRDDQSVPHASKAAASGARVGSVERSINSDGEETTKAVEPPISGKRARDEISQDTSEGVQHEAMSMARRALGPRRSSRLTRPSDGFLTTFAGPGLDTTESFFSLNTTATITQSSQPVLPSWTLSLSKLVSLHHLLHTGTGIGRPRGREVQQSSNKVSLMACVMAVDTPVRRQRKEEKARGQEGTLWIGGWKVTAPPEAAGDRGNTGHEDGGGVGEAGCSVKLWEGLARQWGDAAVRRGDVVLLENVEWKPATSKDPASIVVSPSTSGAQPKVTILYRTLPRRATRRADYLPPRAMKGNGRGRDLDPAAQAAGAAGAISSEDAAFRPDLRLGRSDAGVKRVAEWARWFADWVGGEPP